MATTPKLKPGERAPDFALPNVDDKVVRLSDYLPLFPATVVMFICNHCPYVQAYIPRLVALQKEFLGPAGNTGARSTTAKQVRFIGVCSNDAATYPDDSFENMKLRSREWGLNFPYLRDEDQAAARAFGAERTPEIFVIDSKGMCRYEGGIDDNYQDASKVTRQPLRDALIALIEGREVAEPHTHAIGCSIKWKK